MMKAIPVRIDDRPAPAPEFDLSLGAGILFWMTLVALAIVSFAL